LTHQRQHVYISTHANDQQSSHIWQRCCRGSWRGPQPGGRMHPPSPRGWLSGEVQAILQIYPWGKNTRTHGYLEWFGPPERNTLRPLRDLLFLGLRMSLSSASQSSFGPETFSNGRLPFIEQGGRVHGCWARQVGPMRMYSILNRHQWCYNDGESLAGYASSSCRLSDQEGGLLLSHR